MRILVRKWVELRREEMGETRVIEASSLTEEVTEGLRDGVS